MESLKLGLWEALESRPISQAGLFATFSSSFHGNLSYSYVNSSQHCFEEAPDFLPFSSKPHGQDPGSLMMYCFNWNYNKSYFPRDATFLLKALHHFA